MALNGSRRGVSNLALPLMILAFVLFGAFLFWLSATAEPTQPPVMEEDDDSGDISGGATTVQPGQLGAGAGGFVGQTVRVESTVEGLVGPQAFFISTPSNPFLVRMDSSLVARGMTVEPMQQAIIVGTVEERTDEVVAAWQEDGSIDDNNLPLVLFAEHYLLARQIQVSAPDTASAGGN